MSSDPIFRIAQQRIVMLSAELEVQIAHVAGSGPTIEILKRLKVRAAESLAGLAFLNLDVPADLIKAKVLQNEVKRYDEWIAWMKEIVVEGKQYDQEITEEDRSEMLEYLSQHPEGHEQAIALGLVDREPHDD